MSSTHEGSTPQIHSNGPWGNAYTTEQIAHVKELLARDVSRLEERIKALDEITKERFRGDDLAIQLEKVRLEHRLESLNNSAITASHKATETAVEAQRVASETMKITDFGTYKDAQDQRWEDFTIARDGKFQAFERDLDAGRSAHKVANRAVMLTIVSVLMTIAGWAVQFWLRRP